MDRSWKRVWDMQNKIKRRQGEGEERLQKFGFFNGQILMTRRMGRRRCGLGRRWKGG